MGSMGLNDIDLCIDLNSDLGESFGDWRMGMDEEVMKSITSSNVACGWHAGDPVVMLGTVRAARAAGVVVGAHPGYPDLMGFGRRSMACTPDELYAYTLYQAGALAAVTASAAMGHSWRARSGLSLSWETRTTGRAFLAREERALPKARVLLPYPRRGGQGSGQAQTRGRVLLRPRLPRHARRRRAGLRVLQAMEGAHWPPATDALAIVHTAGLLTHTILTRPTEETRPSAPLCGIRPRLGHLARPCAT